jgi:hypothetical protein
MRFSTEPLGEGSKSAKEKSPLPLEGDGGWLMLFGFGDNME